MRGFLHSNDTGDTAALVYGVLIISEKRSAKDAGRFLYRKICPIQQNVENQ